MRLIDANELKEAISTTPYNDYDDLTRTEKLIDNAPKVFDENAYSQGYKQATCDARASKEIPKGDLISREALKEHIFTVNHGNGVEIEPIEVVPLCVIDNAPTVSDRYDEGFRDGYAQCINDKEERKENNRLFQKGDKEE